MRTSRSTACRAFLGLLVATITTWGLATQFARAESPGPGSAPPASAPPASAPPASAPPASAPPASAPPASAPPASAPRVPASPVPAPPSSTTRPSVEPWLLEGESLEGTDAGGTEIRAPHITHGVLDIRARSGHVGADRDLVTLRDSVVIADTARTLYAREGLYRRALRLLDLAGGVRGVGPEGHFRCGDLTWDRASGRMILRDAPVLVEPDRILEARRVEYETVAGRGVAMGDVRILLLPDSVRAYGERSEYDEVAGRSVLTGGPRLVVPGGDGEPGMTVTADTLILRESDRSGEARGSVRMVRGDLRTSSRRALFELAANRILLTGEPVAWDADGDIRSDTMSVRVRERKADQLRAWGGVRVHYEPRANEGERNLVLGDTLLAGLSGGAITGMDVRGRAQSLYLPGFPDILSGSGRNLCRAQSIHVALRDGAAQRVDLIGGASGTYVYPSDAARQRLADPAQRDSLVPGWALHDSAGPAPDGEPPALPAFLAAWVKDRTLAFPDSTGPFDRLFAEKVEYEGDTIRFFVPEDRIRLQGNATLKYRESNLKSSQIDYDSRRRLVTAIGKPELSDGASTVEGLKMTYRTDEREGIVYRGRTAFDGAFYEGRQVKKMPGNELLVREGDYTTCDQDSAPHYHFHAARMKLIQKDKAVARPVVLYLKRIPVLALPYYVFPLRKGRHSGIMMPDMELGVNRNAGRFARNLGYYWAISDYMDARTWIDYYDKGPKYYLNGSYRYRVRYLLDGYTEGSWLREKDASGGRRKRWSLQSSHSQQLGNNASLAFRANFTSDQSYRSDQNFGAGVDETMNRILKSSVELRKGWSRTSLSGGASRTEYLDATTGGGVKLQVDGPYADFNVNSGAIGRAPDASGRGGHLAALSSVYYGTSFRYRTTYERKFDGKISARRAFQQNASLSDTRRLGPFLRLSPQLSGSWALFGRDNRGESNQAGAAWSFSMSAGNTLYGTYLLPVGPLAGLRHIVEPSVSWGYSPELKQLTYTDPTDSTQTRRLARFPNVGGIGLSGTKRSALSLSLNQRVHARWKIGSRVIKQENLLTLSTSTSYDFLAKPLATTRRTRRFSTISNTLRFKPLSAFETSASVTHDPYTRAPQSFSVRTEARFSGGGGTAPDSTRNAGLQYGSFGDAGLHGAPSGGVPKGTPIPAAASGPWNASFSHSYSTSRGTPRASNNLNISLSFRPTPKWQCNGSVYLDARTREVVSHSFSLARDLHCWDLRFEHRTTGDRAEYYFKVSVKQLPDVQYQRESR